MNLRPPHPMQRQRGVALLWTVVVIIIMILFIGLMIDTVHVVFAAQKLQVGADAASLAGALEVRRNQADARSDAIAIAGLNSAGAQYIQLANNAGNSANGDVVIGHYTRSSGTFTATTATDDVNAFKAVAPRTGGSAGGSLPLLFGPAFGVNTADVSRYAIAMIGGDVGPGVIALNPSKKGALDMRGTASRLVVNGGNIQVNSSHNEAVTNSGQPELDTIELLVTGGVENSFESQVNFNGEIFTGRDPVPDPLAALPAPNYSPSNNLGKIDVKGNKTVNATPGYYAGGISVKNGTLNLASGVYILGGAGLDVNGGDLNANGVMIYIVGNGELNLRGNGQINITPLNPLSYPDGPSVGSFSDARVSIFQARNNSNGGRMLGTNQFNVEGTIYLPAAELEVGGTSNSFGNGLIADTFYFHGSGDMVINYDDRFPKTPRFVFIVE